MDERADEQRDTNPGLDVSQRHPVFMSLPNGDAPQRKPRHAPPPPPPVALGGAAAPVPVHSEFAYPDTVSDLQGPYVRSDSGADAFPNSKNGHGGCVGSP
jgi:hypothetical protein